MNIEQKLAYVQCTFARIGVWQNWTQTQAPNTMTQTIARIFEISWMNYRIFLQRMAAQLRKVLTLKFSEPEKQAVK